MGKRKLLIDSLGVAVGCFVTLGWVLSGAQAQTTVNANWTDATGNWTNASYWSCKCIPNNNSANVFNVTVPTPTGEVFLDNTSSQRSVTINTLSIPSGVPPAMSTYSGVHVESGESLTVLGNVSVTDAASLGVDDGSQYLLPSGLSPISRGGSTVHVDGDLTSSGSYIYTSISIGNRGMTSASTVTVAGVFDNTGNLYVEGGAAGVQALLNVAGAAPSTLTGYYTLRGNTGGAAVEYGTGGISRIGDGSVAPGSLTLVGPNAFMELSNATGRSSALAGLKTIASNGSLELEAGASLNTTGPLTNNGGLVLDAIGSGGSVLRVGGDLTNSSSYEMNIGNEVMTSASTVTVDGTFTSLGFSSLQMYGGHAMGAQALLSLAAAAPSTLTGEYELRGDTGGAAVEYGSGAITQIGDGKSLSSVYLDGSNAYLELSSAPGNNSALAGLKTIANDAYLTLSAGASVTTSGAFTNYGDVRVGAQGSMPGSQTLLNVDGAAPSTLTGSFYVEGGAPGHTAAVEYASGGITQIGPAGSIDLDGPRGYMELSSATGSNSALTDLKTIASGSLELQDGASLTTGGSLTNNGRVSVYGGTLHVVGDLTNSGGIDLENLPPLTSLDVGRNLINTGSGYLELEEGGASVSGEVSNSGRIGVSLGGSLSVGTFSNIGTVELILNAGNSMYPIGVGGSLTVRSGGTYTQTAGSTDVDGTLMAPTVDVAGGRLFGRGTIHANVVNNSIVSPGDPSTPPPNMTLTISGNYTQNADGTLLIDISSATDFRTLDVTGKASLDGIVDFDFMNDYIPGANTDFAFLKAGSVGGDFSALHFMNIDCPTCTLDLSTGILDTGSTPPTSPEPGTLVLFGTGLLGLGCLLRKNSGY